MRSETVTCDACYKAIEPVTGVRRVVVDGRELDLHEDCYKAVLGWSEGKGIPRYQPPFVPTITPSPNLPFWQPNIGTDGWPTIICFKDSGGSVPKTSGTVLLGTTYPAVNSAASAQH